jgi:hypothetical protein
MPVAKSEFLNREIKNSKFVIIPNADDYTIIKKLLRG